METEKILENFKEEKNNLFIEFTNNKMPMTELAIQQLSRLRAINRVERELDGINGKGTVLRDFKVEADQLSKILLDDRTPISPFFMEQIHRLKILTQVMKDLDDEQKSNEVKESYLG